MDDGFRMATLTQKGQVKWLDSSEEKDMAKTSLIVDIFYLATQKGSQMCFQFF